MAAARPILVALLFCLAVTGPAVAAESEAEVQPVVVPDEAVAAPSFLELPIEELPPRLRAIREVLDAQGAKLAELQSRYEVAGTDEHALEIQREMHDVKRGTELALLNAQLAFAREEGDTGKIAELEAVLESIESREGVLAPPARPDGERRESP